MDAVQETLSNRNKDGADVQSIRNIVATTANIALNGVSDFTVEESETSTFAKMSRWLLSLEETPGRHDLTKVFPFIESFLNH